MEIALLMADCVVVPVRPTAADVWTMALVDSRIAAASRRNRGLRAWALINQVSPNPRHTAAAETREVLKSGCAFMNVAGPVLCDRVAFQRAYSEGRTVEEYGSRSEKAAPRWQRFTALHMGANTPRQMQAKPPKSRPLRQGDSNENRDGAIRCGR